MTFTESPAVLTRRQRAIFWIATAVSAGSRLLAVSRSLWDWDEALFCLGMRSYDVASHHPHPPGFPVYIGAANIVRLFTGSDFQALRALNIAAGMLLFPAMFMLARELHMRFTTAMIAASLFVFLPNVWFFGGTAFSDIVSIALVVGAVAFLFRGCRSANAYLIGALLLGLSIGIRPQNALVGLFPAVLSTWYRARQSVRHVVFAVVIGGAVVGVSYGAAIWATGLQPYMNAVREHGEYITRVDSFRSPDRPPLWRLLGRFFIKQYDNPALSIIVSFFVAASIAGAARARDRMMLANALTFTPFAISAWLMLDRYSVSRFSIGYLPMFALFAADGIARITRRPRAEVTLGAALTAAFVIWTLPGLAVARNEISPPVLGVDAVARHVDPRRNDLYVAFPMTPFIDYLLPSVPYHLVLDERAMPLGVPAHPAWLLTELEHTAPPGWVFRREREPLWNIARRHYFEVALEPLRSLPQFGAGWYPVEWEGEAEWRWMQRQSTTVLPPAHPRANLRIQFDVPLEVLPQHPTVTIVLNGAVIDRFSPADVHLAREYDVDPGPGANTLVLSTDRTVNGVQEGSNRDPRVLGLKVRSISWGSEE